MKTKDYTLIALFAALTAICSWISIPAAVPFTLQTFAVFLTVGLLGGKRGTLALLVYILMGAAGTPVFSGFKGGPGALLGNTGGYILGFLGTALTMWAAERLFDKKTSGLAVGMIAGLLVCYAFGTAWFMLLYSKSTGPIPLATVLMWCVAPFVIPDLIKMLLAGLIIGRFKGRVRI